MLSRAVGGLLFSATGGATLAFEGIGRLGIFAAADDDGFADAAGFFAAADFVFSFLAFALAFLATLFFFFSAAAFAFSSRNSDLSCLICFFSSFLRASTCLLAM